MNFAIEVAGYVFAGTVVFGLVLLGFFIRGYLSRPRSVAPYPSARELSSRAIDEAQAVLDKVRQQHRQSGGGEREALELELRRLENRLFKLEQQTYAERQTYLEAVRQRESAWKKWKNLRDKLTFDPHRLSPGERKDLRRVEVEYWKSHRKVEDEWHATVARDLINLEELHGQGVLDSAATAGGAAPAASSDAAVTETPVQEAQGEEAEPESELPGASAGEGLRQADFGHPESPKAGLRYLDSSFELSSVEGGLLSNTDLSGVSFAGVLFKGPHAYHNCDFSGVDFSGVRFEPQQQPHRFMGCNFTGGGFANAHLTYVLFSDCNLSGTNWGGAVLDRIKFVECRMEDVAWEQVDLSRTIMAADSLAQTDFTTAGASPRPQPPSAPRAEQAGRTSPPTHPQPAAEDDGAEDPPRPAEHTPPEN